jgi:hypothetical protein
MGGELSSWPTLRRRTTILRRPPPDRVSAALGVVFLLAAAFYLWTAATSVPLTLHGGALDRYNLLARAFLHLRLWIGRAPAALAHLSEPYNPALNRTLLGGASDATSINDDVLYHGRLYLLWGPAPALVLLVPLELAGFEPSPSLTASIFAIVGLGFALGTLRVLLRQVGVTTLWMCVLAGATLALCSVVPFILRTPSPTEDTIAGGFCFTMAGVWLSASALSSGQASLRRLGLISLCFGFAAGSRPTLGLTALILLPLYTSFRSILPRRRLQIALAAPFGACVLLLLAYNQARFGSFLEFGAGHQLAGYDPLDAHLAGPDYVLPSAWFYALLPPRPLALFPFLVLSPPPAWYPLTLPRYYLTPEITGGLLPTTPILVFLVALPWIWRRRPASLGRLASLPLALTVAGIGSLLLVSYAIFSTTERYEVDFSTLLVLGALASWLALSVMTHGLRRRLVRAVGGALAVWSSLVGIAISFVGYGNYLADRHPGTWSTLERVGSPLSSALAAAAGHPVLAEVDAPNSATLSPVSYTGLGTGIDGFWLEIGERASLTIVSADATATTLTALARPGTLTPGSATIAGGGEAMDIGLKRPGQPVASFFVPRGGRDLAIPIRLRSGINRFQLLALPASAKQSAQDTRARPLALISWLALSSEG